MATKKATPKKATAKAKAVPKKAATRKAAPKKAAAKAAVAKGYNPKKGTFTVPAWMVTKEPKNWFSEQVKYLNNGVFDGKQMFKTFELAHSMTPNGKFAYHVVRLIYLGGKPCVLRYFYHGYSRRDALRVFSGLMFNKYIIRETKNKPERVIERDCTTYEKLMKYNQQFYKESKAADAPKEWKERARQSDRLPF